MTAVTPLHGLLAFLQGSELEQAALEALMEDDYLKPMVPLYFKDFTASEGERYLEMQDLLANFENPSVMDIKMGSRTFLESEVAKKSLRLDLLEKMVALAPDEPTVRMRCPFCLFVCWLVCLFVFVHLGDFL